MRSATVEKAGLRLICHQNEVGLRHRDDPTIIGWMHGDGRQRAVVGTGKGYDRPFRRTRLSPTSNESTLPILHDPSC